MMIINIFMLLITMTLAQCQTNQYWSQDVGQSGECKPCPTKCATCWSGHKCTSCVEGYLLDVSYQCVQQQTINNCKTYEGLYCVECEEGYYLSGNRCTKCDVEKCSKCDLKKCYKCDEGLILYEEKNTHGVIVSQSCLNCSLPGYDEECGRCPLGKYFNTTTFKCTPCRENCRRCTTGSNCYLCAENMALDNPADPESICKKLDNCEDGHYYGNHCEVCKKGYYVNRGFCSPCGGNCTRCINANECVECDQGSVLQEDKTCNKIPNCIRSSDLMGCVECEHGYFLTEMETCEKCGDTCDTCYNSTYCFSCKNNYYFTDVERGICEKKNDLRCDVADQYGCLHCKYYIPYKSDDGTGWNTFDESDLNEEIIKKKIQDEAQKKQLDEDNDRYMNTSIGFYLGYTVDDNTGKIVSEKECSMCNPACRMCEYNSDWCTACNDGYEMKYNDTATKLFSQHFGNSTTQIYNCEKQSEECVQTQMGYCTKCVDTHFLSGILCAKCDVSCSSCIKSSYCQQCNVADVDEKGNVIYWRPQAFSEKEEEEKGLCLLVSNTSAKYHLDNCAVPLSSTGCSECKEKYYENTRWGGCKQCPDECYRCKLIDPSIEDDEDAYTSDERLPNDKFVCTSCQPDIEYLKDGKCVACDTIDNCELCDDNGCKQCEGDYTLSPDKMSCTRVNIELIIPLVCGGLLIIIVVIVVILIIILRKRRKQMKEREKEIKTFKVTNEIEMALLSADNTNFPLQTDTWTLDFGHKGTKVVIDEDYEQIVVINNPTKKTYFFEILSGASHRYELKAEPMRFTLKQGMAVEVKFTIKMLCTAVVQDEIGIIAADVDEDSKETAKLTIMVESDISTKLDHTELKLQMPAIGEGAFGLVFRGTYRGQGVAVKKMKARNLTPEQEKEFKHEVNMLTQFRHPTVVNLLGAVYTEGEISIVTEFAEYGSLSKIWKKEKISYDLKIKFMEDAVVALAYLHENQVIHRDIKGENVLVYSLNPHSPVCGKLTDFGTCRNISERALQAKELSMGIGTPTYMAPECLANSNYTLSADIYSFAIVLYETFTEVNAYLEDPRFNQPWMIPQFVISGKRLERPEKMPDDYWALIELCWKPKATDRPTFPQIYATLAQMDVDIVHTEINSKEQLTALFEASSKKQKEGSSSEDDDDSKDDVVETGKEEGGEKKEESSESESESITSESDE